MPRVQFLYDLVGLRQAPSSIGWQQALVWPAVPAHPALPYASGLKASVAGTLQVAWQTSDGSQCVAGAPENVNITLACPGAASNVITAIPFADFGLPDGACSNFTVNPACSAANSTAIVAAACLGKQSCTVYVSDTVFGDPCYGTVKHFSAVAQCAQSAAFLLTATVPANTGATVMLPYLAGNTSSITVTEGGATVYTNGAFVPGTPGVTAAYLVANASSVAVEVGSGTYNFAIL